MGDKIIDFINAKKYNVVICILYLCLIIKFTIVGYSITGNVWGTSIKYIILSYCIIGLLRYGISYFADYCKSYSRTNGNQLLKRVFSISAIFFALTIYSERSSFVDFIYDLQKNFIDLVSVNNVDMKMVSKVFLVGIPLFLVILSFMIKKHLEVVISASLFIGLIVLDNLGYKRSVDKIIIMFILFNLIIFGFKRMHREKEHTQKYRYNIVTIVSVALIVAILGNYFSLDYKGLKESIGGSKAIINSKNVTGLYDSSGKIGGPISLDEKLAFKYSFPNGVTDGVTYFTADTDDYYTGVGWKKSSFKKEINLEKFKKSITVSNKYKNDVEIYPEEEVKGILLTPSYSYNITSVNKHLDPSYDQSRGVFEIKKDNGNSYDVEFIDDAFFQQYPYENESKYKKRVSNFLHQYFEEKDNIEMFQMYTQLPATITKRTKDLVYDITKNCKYDYERVEAIRRYLTLHYTYSLNPPNVPEGKEVVDYFLFDEKIGYCVYFATAMTVMCRIAGIPARFVRGFKDSYTIKKENTLYELNNKDSHAWCEVFVDTNLYNGSNKDETWVISDATATPNEYSMKHVNEEQKRLNDNESFVYDGSNKKPKSQQANFNPYSNMSHNYMDRYKNMNTNNAQPKGYSKLMIIGVVLLILLLLCFIRILWIIIKNTHIRKNKEISKLYVQSLKLASFAGYRKSSLETDLEFASNISHPEINEIMLKTVKEMNGQYYGGYENKSHDTESFQRLKAIVKRKGKFNYYLKTFFHY